MVVTRHHFDDELTQDKMLGMLRERVRRVYGMTLLEYAHARRGGRLPNVPGKAALEVFAGDFGTRAPKQAHPRAERTRG